MKTRGFIVTLLTVFFFAATALAGGPANMKTDVPTIPEADCDQAGWISLEVAGGFDLHEGDQIVWSTTNNVPLCKDVNIFLSVTELITKSYPVATERAIRATSGADTITVADFAGTDDVGLAGELENGAGDAWELGFLIQGTAGSTRIRLTVTRRWATVVTNAYADPGNLTGNYEGMLGVGNDGAGGAVGSGQYILTFNAITAATDVLTIRLFDQNEDEFNDGVSQAGFYEKDVDAPFGYINDIEPEDNVLCLDTNNDATLVNGQYVWATPDSQPGTTPGASQVSFSGDYTIANIAGSEGYTVEPVGKAECEDINIADDVDQFGNPIGPVAENLDVGDYSACAPGIETRWGLQNGFCDDTANGFGVLISKSTSFALAEQYGITIQLAKSTDGGSTFTNIDADEAYWTTVPDIYETTTTAPGNIQCAADAAVASNAGVPTAIDEEDSEGTSRILGVEYDYFNVVSSDNDAFMVDLGNFSVVKAAFDAGDIIYARVTVTKFPCGEVSEEYICLGNIVDGCGGVGAVVTDFLYFPYGVAANNASFWTGIAITNVSATDGTATLTFWGEEGGQSTYDLPVGAYSLESIAVSQIYDVLVGDLAEDERFQVTVSTDFAPADGICFIGGKGTNTVMHGYLPRKNDLN